MLFVPNTPDPKRQSIFFLKSFRKFRKVLRNFIYTDSYPVVFVNYFTVFIQKFLKAFFDNFLVKSSPKAIMMNFIIAPLIS